MFSIPVSKLSAASMCAPIKHIRTNLNSVCVDFNVDGKVYIVAIDGNCAFIDELGEHIFESHQITIPLNTVKLALATKDKCVLLEKVGNSYTLNDVPFTPNNSSFPDWQRVVPNKTSGEVANYDYDLLAKGQKAMRKALGAKHSFFELKHNGASAGVMICHNDYPKFVVAAVRV